MDSKTVITKETKNRISVDYEGKLSFKERLKKKLSTSNTWIKVIVEIFKFILMLGVSYVILFPFFSKVAGSFMTYEDVVDPTVSLIPKNFTLEVYKALIVENRYFSAFFNTLLLSLICALIQTFVACLIGYGLAKFKFKLNGFVMMLVIITMIIPHNVLQRVMYERFVSFDFFNLLESGKPGIIELIFGEPIELVNTFWPFVIFSAVGLAFKNGLYIYLMRQFFKGVPDELEESAYVDGSGTFRTFIQIILPLSIPMMITIFLFSFSWQWMDEFYTNMFLTDPDGVWSMLNFKNITKELSVWNSSAAGKEIHRTAITNTAGILIISPLVVMYLFCQRYLVQGIERSGLVG